MDSKIQVGTTDTLMGRKANASRIPQPGDATLPKNAGDWLFVAIKKAKETSGDATITLPAKATRKDIGYFLKCTARAGMRICKEGGKMVIQCVEEGGKLFGLVKETGRKVLLPDGASDLAGVL